MELVLGGAWFGAAGRRPDATETPRPQRGRDEAARARAEAASRLLVSAGRGDARDFEALYRATAPRLLAHAQRLVRDAERAEEVLQDAFVVIWQRAADFDPTRASAFTWMATIVRNRCFDLMRTPAFAQGPSRSTLDPAAVIDAAADPGPGPEARHDLQRELARMATAMRTLPGTYRQALAIAYGEGCSHAELAERLRIPVGTAKSWVRRGLQQLRAAFEGHDGAPRQRR